MSDRRRAAILISGRGSNMMKLIAAARQPEYPAEIALVFSNRPDAPGLQLAEQAGITAASEDSRAWKGQREPYDRALDARLGKHGIEYICLAGYMRLLTPWFCSRWHGRMLNIHPSLLPSFAGLDTHARALAAGVKLHGCTVHFVSPDVDAGPIVAQRSVPVLDGDTPDALAERVLVEEHRLYPAALAVLAAGGLRIENGRVFGADALLDPAHFSGRW